MPLRRSTVLAAVVAAWSCVPVATAPALISSATTIDGPSADIRGFGGVAMADDGTGGLVYLKRVDGRDHVFVAQYVGGEWKPAQRADAGQRFDSSWPAIGAGEGGRLVVVWVQEFGPADRLYSASLQPGSRRVQSPVPIDLNVGDSALGVHPSVSLNRAGQGYVVYRTITDAQPSTAPPGDVLGEYRLARYAGELWSPLGSPLNRNPAAPQAAPSVDNAPRIGTDLNGNAVVAWQEADDAFIDRIYARRVFGANVGIAQQVSPATFGGKPLRASASQLSLDVGPFGQAAIAWRQEPGSGAALAGRRVLAAQLPDAFATAASSFDAPRILDGGGEAGPAGAVGPASVAVSADRVLVAAGQGVTAQAIGADAATVDAAERLDDGTGLDDPLPRVDLADSGAAAFAWRTDAAGGRGTVRVRERRADGVQSDRALSGPRGGVITRLDLEGSGLGDAVVGWQQGTGSFTQIVGAVVDAPPDVFNVQVPLTWVRTDRVPVSWDATAHAIGGVTYTLTADDDEVAGPLTGVRALIDAEELEDGVHTVQVIAADPAGQETTSVPAQLKLDRTAPKVGIGIRARRAVGVRIVDGPAGGVSGNQPSSTRVSFGDGRSVGGRSAVVHRYRRPGRFRVTVITRDKAGNAGRTVKVVNVR